MIVAVDNTFLVINLALLMCVAFVPFPTGLVAAHLRDDGLRAAALAYGMMNACAGLCFNVLWFYASRGNRLIAADISPQTKRAIARSYVPGPPIWAAAGLIALWNPIVSIAIFATLNLFYLTVTAFFAPAR